MPRARSSSSTAARCRANATQLEALPGVGRKTANVVMSVAFERPAFAVDTHVFRVSHRLGLTLGKTPRAVEDDVTKLVPPEEVAPRAPLADPARPRDLQGADAACARVPGDDVPVAARSSRAPFAAKA